MSEGDGAVKDYSLNPSKAHWRRTAWNFIAKHADPRGVGVVLLGAQALDVPVAQSKGIDPRRIVAVERDGDAARRLRRQGIVAIHGDIRQILPFLQDRGMRLSFVLADMCGPVEAGLVEAIRMTFDWVGAEWSRFALVANLLRGRESDDLGRVAIGRHRGESIWDLTRDRLDDECPHFMGRKVSTYFHSYRSGALVYDSLMLAVRQRWNVEEIMAKDVRLSDAEVDEILDWLRRKQARLAGRLLSGDLSTWKGHAGSEGDADRRSLTAALAVLTARGVDWRLEARSG